MRHTSLDQDGEQLTALCLDAADIGCLAHSVSRLIITLKGLGLEKTGFYRLAYLSLPSDFFKREVPSSRKKCLCWPGESSKYFEDALGLGTNGKNEPRPTSESRGAALPEC